MLCAILRGFLLRRFCLTAEPFLGKGPVLIVANHVTNWDPLLLAMSFPNTPIRYVASEHIFRHGWISKLLEWLVAPIPRKKAASGADTVMAVLRALKAGDNVCIFAEGDATWDGLTHPVFPATGKLARMSGAALVTYRLEGGYLSLPRWSKTVRRGKMRGAVVGIYSAEELKTMKGPEITALIDRDLYEDAWSRQKTEHVRFRAENRAEGIERGFFICPRCGEPGKVRGVGNRVVCGCGLDLLYTEEGFFEPAEPVATVAEWESMQREALEKRCQTADSMFFADKEMTLRAIGGGHRESLLGKGQLSQLPDALEIAGRRFPLKEIDSMAMVKANILLFSVGDSYYEIRAAASCCLRKYLLVWQIART
jgi:1-acyl-sn-glycerol-3-phosphate acyltransferase